MTPPTREQVREWIGIPATALSDEQLDGIIAAEVDAQSTVCFIDPALEYPALYQALLRRAGRAAAARSLPTGLVGLSEYGMARLPGVDAEIERYEAPHRAQVLG